MRDRTKIAINVWLPSDLSKPVPTILRQTRYFRSINLRFPLSIFTGGRPIDHSGLYAERRKQFLKAGYAWVDVDVRGSGASTGHRICPWSGDEIRDGAEVVDWIIHQDWSSKKVGSLGISYDGTASEMLLVNQHPAVRAIAPRFACYDSFSDIGFPNGVFNRWFNKSWGESNRALDANRLAEVGGWYVDLITSGVSRVSSDQDGQILAAAIADHQDNYDVIEKAHQMAFCDDEPDDDSTSAEDVSPQKASEGLRGTRLFSPNTHRSEVAASGAAIYSVGGWWDGAYARAAAQRYHSVPNDGSQLLLGPWNHGGGWHIEPANKPVKNKFDHNAELISFFDRHLKEESASLEPPKSVKYYTLIESVWKTSETWPPTESKLVDFFLTDNRELAETCPLNNSATEYQVVEAGSGTVSRWRTQSSVDGKVCYSDRRQICENLLCFQMDALQTDFECTGHGVVDFFLASNSLETYLFVYLEEVLPDGKVLLITEGLLDTRHRRVVAFDQADSALNKLGVPHHSFKRCNEQPLHPCEDPTNAADDKIARLQFDLLPTSYLIRKGRKLQISISGTDTDQFRVPNPLPKIAIFHGPKYPSRIQLPIIRRV